MGRPWKVAAVVAGVLAGLVCLSLFGSGFSVDAEPYKSRFEADASGPLGMKVSVRGRLGIAFTGDLVLVLRDVHVRNTAGAEVLSAERATIAVAVLPLLYKQHHIRRVELTRPRVAIERGGDGILNWARRAKPRGTIPSVVGARLSLARGTVRYKDDATGTVLEATDVNAVARPKKRTLEFDPITMNLFGGKGRASLRADVSDSIPRYRLRCSLSRFRVDECLRTLSPDSIATGTMDFAANVSSTGRTSDDWAKGLEGDVVLRGQEIELHGRDLDKDFSRFESSQNLDLTDVGSFFFVGPLAMVVTKGYDFARLVRRSGGRTHIRAVISSWDVRNGSLKAKDVALATSKNRVALRGNLDFARQRFDSMTVAVIDKDGCAKVRQELRGTFKEPELTKPMILWSILGPARKVVTRVVGLLPGKCEVFYAGSVEHPE